MEAITRQWRRTKATRAMRMHEWRRVYVWRGRKGGGGTQTRTKALLHRGVRCLNRLNHRNRFKIGRGACAHPSTPVMACKLAVSVQSPFLLTSG